MIAPADVALGILAGGRGERVGGRDKAWLPRGGVPALDGLLSELQTHGFGEKLASVRDGDARWAARGFRCVTDLHPGQPGPLAGIEALATAGTTPWLLLLPVDVFDLPPRLFDQLAALASPKGCCLRDASGLQPLVGLWPRTALGNAASAALAAGEATVHRALATLQPATLDITPRRLGNANTPDAYDGPP